MKKKHTDERGMRTEKQKAASLKLKQRRPPNGSKVFDPDHDVVESATEEFLKRGGKIKRRKTKKSAADILNEPISSALDNDFKDSDVKEFIHNVGYRSSINMGSFIGRF